MFIIISAALVVFGWLAVYLSLERFSGLAPDETFYISLAILVFFGILFQKKTRPPIRKSKKT